MKPKAKAAPPPKKKRGVLLLLGVGHMGSALLRGWLTKGIDAEIRIADPALTTAQKAQWARKGARAINTASDLQDETIATLVLAVKPQLLTQAARPFVERIGNGLIISIAAGTTMAALRDIFGPEPSILRAMPNAPAKIGRSVTVLVEDPSIAPSARRTAQQLLSAIGTVIPLNNEAMIDAVTALSGSGPAYVYLLTEAMRDAGVAAGLPQDLSARLARETVTAAAALLEADKSEPEILRQSVTSPGGTTEAALKILMRDEDGLRRLMRDAILAATARGRALAQA